jgi:CelD/BcsL family acetyltransferase involved in cellulose biosynthesis
VLATVEVIEADEALGPLLDPWRELAVARGSAFATPEWFLAAREALHPDAAPAIIVARDDRGEVRGLVPLLAWSPARGSRLASHPGTRFGDLFEPVTERGCEEELAAMAAPALHRHLGSRCRIDLGRVEAGAGWWRELARAWPGAMTAVPQPDEPLPYISLRGLDWQGYLATRSGQLRNQVKRKMRSLERDHDVSLRRTQAAEQVAGDLETLFELHDARFQTRDDASSIAGTGARELHRRFAAAAHERGWLRLYRLEVDGAAVAAWYGWRVGERFSYYQAGFDPSWSRYSVGFLLLAETIREAIQEGADEYDLLLGDEAFKTRFATDQRLGCRVLLAPPISGGRLAAAARGLARSGMRAMPEPARERVRALRNRIRR